MMKLTLSTIAWSLALTASAQLTTPQIELPDPLLMNDGKTLVTELKDWKARRLEIADMIQTFGIGQKPEVAPEAVKARMDGDTLIVDVTVNNETLTLKSCIHYPATGQPPYALMIGTSMLSLPKPLFENRPIAIMNFIPVWLWSLRGLPIGRSSFQRGAWRCASVGSRGCL
jgi:hypothetical protein